MALSQEVFCDFVDLFYLLLSPERKVVTKECKSPPTGTTLKQRFLEETKRSGLANVRRTITTSETPLSTI